MSNEFMGKTYNFDPDNVLTRGLPVPPGYRPLAPGEAPRDTDWWCLVQDAKSFSYDLINVQTDFQRCADWSSAGGERDEDDILFRRIEWSADLLARIPEGFEAYDRPGEPPESMEGWKRVVMYDPCDIVAASQFFRLLEFWLEGPPRSCVLADYGRTWCLARPKVAEEPLRECQWCGVSSAHRKPHRVLDQNGHNYCAVCWDRHVFPADGNGIADGWRVVDHPSREERDARAIDAKFGSIALLTVVERAFRAGRGERRLPLDDSKMLVRLPEHRRLEGWRSGDEPEPHDERLSVQVQHEEDV